MSKDILLQMVTNQRGGIDPSPAIRAAVTATLSPGTDCRIVPDPATGTYKIFRYWTVIPDIVDETTDVSLIPADEMQLHEAVKIDPDATIGGSVSKEIHFSRIEYQTFKRLFTKEMRKAERHKITGMYQERIGEIFMVSVASQQFNRDGIILEMDDGVEMFLPHTETIPREEIRPGDRCYVCLHTIDEENKGSQLIASRKSLFLLEGLFKLKILEIQSGIIEVKASARDAGSRAKVAVKTNDGRLNPIGTCIGRSGERVQAISNELNGEHIDIVLWDDNPAQLAIHALAPAEVVSITMDEDIKVMDIAVRKDNLPRAIGRNGQNVRLASQLTGWTLNIMSLEEASQKQEMASSTALNTLKTQLDISTEDAQRLIQEGLTTIEEVAQSEPEVLKRLLQAESAQIERIQNQANDLLLAEAFASESENFETDTLDDQSLETLKGMTTELYESLTTNQVNSRDELAELSIDDLLEIVPSLTRDSAGQLIMNARAHWFK